MQNFWQYAVPNPDGTFSLPPQYRSALPAFASAQAIPGGMGSGGIPGQGFTMYPGSGPTSPHPNFTMPGGTGVMGGQGVPATMPQGGPPALQGGGGGLPVPQGAGGLPVPQQGGLPAQSSPGMIEQFLQRAQAALQGGQQVQGLLGSSPGALPGGMSPLDVASKVGMRVSPYTVAAQVMKPQPLNAGEDEALAAMRNQDAGNETAREAARGGPRGFDAGNPQGAIDMPPMARDGFTASDNPAGITGQAKAGPKAKAASAPPMPRPRPADVGAPVKQKGGLDDFLATIMQTGGNKDPNAWADLMDRRSRSL